MLIEIMPIPMAVTMMILILVNQLHLEILMKVDQECQDQRVVCFNTRINIMV